LSILSLAFAFSPCLPSINAVSLLDNSTLNITLQ
jgi:hypothetical protein